MPNSPTRPLAKSLLWVRVQMLVPSPGTMIVAPRRIRSTIVYGFCQLPMTTGIWEGRSQRGPDDCRGEARFTLCPLKDLLARDLVERYCQKGFTVGVASVISQCEGGFSYTDAELMNTYWPAAAKIRTVLFKRGPGVTDPLDDDVELAPL